MTGCGWRSCLVLLLVAGCANPGRPPVAERSPVFSPRPATYTVNRGDTLYSIAWRFDLDFRTLAQSNKLRAPYKIIPGQKIHLNSQTTTHTPRARAPRERPTPISDSVAAPVTTGWLWPTTARVTRGYTKYTRGLDFALPRAPPITAAAAGRVVYAGTGLGGFRQLIIIKHDERFLSAYSLHQTGRVEEGESLRAGQLIAKVTNADSAALTLHFEIRKDGQPVDPRSLLGTR